MAYIPNQGEVVWINLNPKAGHEQEGRRPALVLSPAAYNGKVGLAILCPITNRIKGYPFEVLIPPGLDGAVRAGRAGCDSVCQRADEFNLGNTAGRRRSSRAVQFEIH